MHLPNLNQTKHAYYETTHTFYKMDACRGSLDAVLGQLYRNSAARMSFSAAGDYERGADNVYRR